MQDIFVDLTHQGGLEFQRFLVFLPALCNFRRQVASKNRGGEEQQERFKELIGFCPSHRKSPESRLPNMLSQLPLLASSDESTMISFIAPLFTQVFHGPSGHPETMKKSYRRDYFHCENMGGD